MASIEKVADELNAGKDELSEWASDRGDDFFLATDDAVPALRTVSAWENSQDYKPAAVHRFLQVADYWLVAHALEHQFIIVTLEVPGDKKGKIKIPNACSDLGLGCVSPYEMLRRERARFVLGPGREVA